MNTVGKFIRIGVCGAVIWAFTYCANKNKVVESEFTEADSLTEVYLALQDSLHDTWSLMISDDNQKIKSMKALLHELSTGTPYSPEKLESYALRIDQLQRIRFTAKTMYNADVIEEYDFASNSLVTELIAMAESVSSFAYNTTIQKLVEDIRAADMRIENYRAEYDSTAAAYNRLIEQHDADLKEACDLNAVTKKALFSSTEE